MSHADFLALPTSLDEFHAKRASQILTSPEVLTDGYMLVRIRDVVDTGLLRKLMKRVRVSKDAKSHDAMAFLAEESSGPDMLELVVGKVGADIGVNDSEHVNFRIDKHEDEVYVTFEAAVGGERLGRTHAGSLRLLWTLLGGWDRMSTQRRSSVVIFWKNNEPAGAILRARSKTEAGEAERLSREETDRVVARLREAQIERRNLGGDVAGIDPALTETSLVRLVPHGTRVDFFLLGGAGDRSWRAQGHANAGGMKVSQAQVLSTAERPGFWVDQPEASWSDFAAHLGKSLGHAAIAKSEARPVGMGEARPVAVNSIGSRGAPWEASLDLLRGEDPVEVWFSRDTVGPAATLLWDGKVWWVVGDENVGDDVTALWPLDDWRRSLRALFGGEDPPVDRFARLHVSRGGGGRFHPERGSVPATLAAGRQRPVPASRPGDAHRFLLNRVSVNHASRPLSVLSESEITRLYAPGVVVVILRLSRSPQGGRHQSDELGALEVVAEEGGLRAVWHPIVPPLKARAWSLWREPTPPRPWSEFAARHALGMKPGWHAEFYAEPRWRFLPRRPDLALPWMAPDRWRPRWLPTRRAWSIFDGDLDTQLRGAWPVRAKAEEFAWRLRRARSLLLATHRGAA